MDAFVAKHLQGVSRTYAIVVPMLPAPLADTVGVAYLLMRVVDTIEDDPQLSTEQRQRYFELLDAALAGDEVAATQISQPIGVTDAERALMTDAGRVLGQVLALEPAYCDAVRACAQAMSTGVRGLIQRSAERNLPYPGVRDATELREYCYYVAGVVGEMLCAMMAHFLKLSSLLRLRELAVELGIGLQLVNILKDALRDSDQGRRYLPIAAGGDVAHTEIYKAVLQEARRSLARGMEFVLALPAAARELRSFCGLPIAWGAMTLARAERDAARAKIGRTAIRSSIAEFAQVAGDDGALRRWLTSMLQAGAGPEDVANVVVPGRG